MIRACPARSRRPGLAGEGTSEEIVGEAIEQAGARDRVVLATKLGIEWGDEGAWRNSSPERVRAEVEDSLRRLRSTSPP